MNVFLDGRLEFSNNRAERSMKPFVIGRKNWLFSNSVSGVKASAIAFSIIETAKENGLKPFEYLKFLMETLSNSTTGMLDAAMPWNDDCTWTGFRVMHWLGNFLTHGIQHLFQKHYAMRVGLPFRKL